jgi:hypothetical protein
MLRFNPEQNTTIANAIAELEQTNTLASILAVIAKGDDGGYVVAISAMAKRLNEEQARTRELIALVKSGVDIDEAAKKVFQ